MLLLLYTHTSLCTPAYTHIHRYHNGNDQDQGQIRGFGHVGYLTPDLTLACAYLEEQGVAFKKKPTVCLCMYILYCINTCCTMYILYTTCTLCTYYILCIL